MFDKDRLMNAKVFDVAEAAMGVVTGVQLRRPEAQVLGMAACFLMTCERYGISAQDAFTAVTNMMNEGEGKSPEFTAARMYVENEL